MKIRFLVFFGLLSLFLPTVIFAKVGVGVATGKIVVQDKLKPGVIYHLPPLTVVNTGDEISNYSVGINYLQNQKELMPDKSWFIFSPKEFSLAPGKVQVVTMTLDLPVNAKPGDYFAFVEGYPIRKTQTGQATISIAAASKLYFTVIPANLFQAMYYKTASLWEQSQPWTTWFLILVIAGGVILSLNKFFHIEINLKRKGSAQVSDHETNE